MGRSGRRGKNGGEAPLAECPRGWHGVQLGAGLVRSGLRPFVLNDYVRAPAAELLSEANTSRVPSAPLVHVLSISLGDRAGDKAGSQTSEPSNQASSPEADTHQYLFCTASARSALKACINSNLAATCLVCVDENAEKPFALVGQRHADYAAALVPLLARITKALPNESSAEPETPQVVSLLLGAEDHWLLCALQGILLLYPIVYCYRKPCSGGSEPLGGQFGNCLDMHPLVVCSIVGKLPGVAESDTVLWSFSAPKGCPTGCVATQRCIGKLCPPACDTFMPDPGAVTQPDGLVTRDGADVAPDGDSCAQVDQAKAAANTAQPDRLIDTVARTRLAATLDAWQQQTAESSAVTALRATVTEVQLPAVGL
eukprot:m.112868 g.112868  ORF g.112868 m.112868 type:complete len:370 (-) comp16207_c1_seq1:357-1466(-)